MGIKTRHTLATILLAHAMVVSVSPATLFDDLYGGANGLFGAGLTVPIAGVGGIKIQCDPPELKFNNFDFCDMATKITSKYNNLRTSMNFSSPFLSCTVGISELNSIKSCKTKLLGAICGGGPMINRSSLQAIRMGFGSIVKPTKSKIAIFGSKGLFGKNLCANDAKRITKFTTPAMIKVYGARGESDRILYDADIGGSPLMLNTREAATYLRCAEAAHEAGLPTDKCNPKIPIDAAEVAQGSGGGQYGIDNILGGSSGISQGIDYAAGDMAPYNNRQPSGSKKQLALDYYPSFKYWAGKKGISDTLWLMAVAAHEGGFKGGRTNKNFVFNKTTGIFDKSRPSYCGSARGLGTGVRSVDQGFMQINNCWHHKTVEKLMGRGAYPQAIMSAQRGIEYGASVLGKCWSGSGDIEEQITCYNGAKQKGSKYFKAVKTEYAWLKDMDFGDAIPFVSGAQTDMESTVYDTLAQTATEHSTTLTHSGRDVISHISESQRDRMREVIIKNTARQALITSSVKKGGDAKKSLNTTTQVQYSNASDQTNAGLGFGIVPAISRFLNIPLF